MSRGSHKKRLSGKTTANIRARLHSVSPFCHWCKIPLDLRDTTLDHIEPLSAGGTNGAHNFALACVECNQQRNYEDQCKRNETKTTRDAHVNKFLAHQFSRFDNALKRKV